jgi:hypothetical protein
MSPSSDHNVIVLGGGDRLLVATAPGSSFPRSR